MEFAQRLFSTRSGTLTVGAIAALLAAGTVAVYVKSYRESLSSGADSVPVLVAKQLIPKGVSGEVIREKEMFQLTNTPRKELSEGALSDAALVRGKVTTADVYPGEQLTAASFTATATAVATRLAGKERAITLPLDEARGLAGVVQPDDRVDVVVGFTVTPVDGFGRPQAGGQQKPVVKTILQDVPVLNASGGGGVGGGSGNNVTLRVTERQGAELAFASQHGQIWLSLRPASGAPAEQPRVVTIETMLLGVSPVAVEQKLGARR